MNPKTPPPRPFDPDGPYFISIVAVVGILFGFCIAAAFVFLHKYKDLNLSWSWLDFAAVVANALIPLFNTLLVLLFFERRFKKLDENLALRRSRFQSRLDRFAGLASQLLNEAKASHSLKTLRRNFKSGVEAVNTEQARWQETNSLMESELAGFVCLFVGVVPPRFFDTLYQLSKNFQESVEEYVGVSDEKERQSRYNAMLSAYQDLVNEVDALVLSF